MSASHALLTASTFSDSVSKLSEVVSAVVVFFAVLLLDLFLCRARDRAFPASTDHRDLRRPSDRSLDRRPCDSVVSHVLSEPARRIGGPCQIRRLQKFQVRVHRPGYPKRAVEYARLDNRRATCRNWARVDDRDRGRSDEASVTGEVTDLHADGDLVRRRQHHLEVRLRLQAVLATAGWPIESGRDRAWLETSAELAPDSSAQQLLC